MYDFVDRKLGRVILVQNNIGYIMAETDKRMDAAHMLAVPYNATPNMVRVAYKNRVLQRLYFNNADNDDIKKLYNARVRMEFAPNRQWLAQLKLAFTSSDDKHCCTLRIILKDKRRMAHDIVEKSVLDDTLKTLASYKCRYNIMRAICVYELTGLGAMMVYDNVCPEHGVIVPSIVYGSMLIMGGALGFVMDSLDKKRKEIEALDALLQIIKLGREMKQFIIPGQLEK